ncbi:MAG: hypothetical protein JW892_12720 [Anaerolineae bacterium]|nr:hypothetical protein [Anaerolineae bacterium]
MEEEIKHTVEEEAGTTPGSEPGTLPEGAGVGPEAAKTGGTRPSSGSSFISALEKSMESLSKALGTALEDRANVVMVRINDEALRHLDMLVEAEVTKSRSESAALLISEGIRANQALFDKIGDITRQIAELREQLRQSIAINE